jgi:hypothetical protein
MEKTRMEKTRMEWIGGVIDAGIKDMAIFERMR